jgi:hypothetical protein
MIIFRNILLFPHLDNEVDAFGGGPVSLYDLAEGLRHEHTLEAQGTQPLLRPVFE